MTNVKTFGTVLKKFQQDAVDNGTMILGTCLMDLWMVRGATHYEESRDIIVGDLGALLIEAPTGTGKTLMAGHIVQNVSKLYQRGDAAKVLWLWFAPYTGLVDQAARTIREEFKGLRPRLVATERDPETIRSGDVFVTTWAGVLTSQRPHEKTEAMPSLDGLLAFARAEGYVIGVVVDEAHHTFKEQNQSFAFYREILDPELTILTTATPKDRDIGAFTSEAGITNLRRIAVSRRQAIDDHLIKEGVKVAVFKAPSDVESLIDFKKTAIRQAVATHRKIKETLTENGLDVVPLLLVQVDSSSESISQVTEWLHELGFKKNGDKELIKVHTADEPDPHLSAIASDESVEVLIFKMAVALGFDAPRAFSLVSFRRNRDEDFGVQIVGRILRVDRRLQNLPKIPDALDYGFVFLSDMSGQSGLSSAAQRINAVKAELASVTSNIAVVAIGEEQIAQTTRNGQTVFIFASDKPAPEFVTEDALNEEEVASQPNELQRALWGDWGLLHENDAEGSQQPEAQSVEASAPYAYPLNELLNAPRVFKKALLALDGHDILSDIVARFRFGEDVLLVAQQSAAQIIQDEVEIFQNRRGVPKNIRAELAQKEIDARAQLTLFKSDPYDVIDIRQLHSALMQQLRIEVERRGLDCFNTETELRDGLHKILALRPKQLKRAISEAVAQHTVSEDADPIPAVLRSSTELTPARLNLYGVFPEDLNSWERPFAEYLDDDLTGTVLWWHRNPVRKAYSVSLPLPGQPQFYPDFIVGVNGRKHGHGILLAETKREINDQAGNAAEKAQAKHPYYGKVMMLYWSEKREWRVVEFDASKNKNFLDQLLRPEVMKVC